MAALDALIFDLGNVLAFHDNALMLARLGERLGLPPNRLSTVFEGSLAFDMTHGALGGDDIRRVLLERLGLPPSTLSQEEFFQLFNCHFRVNDEVLPVIERLLGRYRVLLLSNTNELHARFLLPKLPILERFHRVLLSHEVHLAKPEPAIYLLAVTEAGTSPERALFFDDLPLFVQAARKVGLRAEVFEGVRTLVHQLHAHGVEV